MAWATCFSIAESSGYRVSAGPNPTWVPESRVGQPADEFWPADWWPANWWSTDRWSVDWWSND